MVGANGSLRQFKLVDPPAQERSVLSCNDELIGAGHELIDEILLRLIHELAQD